MFIRMSNGSYRKDPRFLGSGWILRFQEDGTLILILRIYRGEPGFNYLKRRALSLFKRLDIKANIISLIECRNQVFNNRLAYSSILEIKLLEAIKPGLRCIYESEVKTIGHGDRVEPNIDSDI